MNYSTSQSSAVSDELPISAEYRPLCLSALGALLLGLASVLTLATPVLAIVPLLAVVMAVVALRQISAASQALSGRRLALAGLCLAALFFGWGLASHLHHQARVRDGAREFADDWLRILSTGDLARAYQLHSSRESRQDPHAIKPRMTMNPGERDTDIEDFFHDLPLDEFLAAGPEVKFRFEEFVRQSRDSAADRVVLKYTFDGKSGPIPIWITVRRTFGNVSRAPDWELFAVNRNPPEQ